MFNFTFKVQQLSGPGTGVRLTQEQRNSNIQIPMAMNEEGRLDLETMLTAVIDNTAKDLGCRHRLWR
ncbi:MAG: hypothetical protein KQI78_25090 [Deltaproteobacteria bacterium]|nr:hypothetical protein [Deltaproteobacteria bacterium]